MPADEWINSTREELATRMRLAQQREESESENSENSVQSRDLNDFGELEVSADEYR